MNASAQTIIYWVLVAALTAIGADFFFEDRFAWYSPAAGVLALLAAVVLAFFRVRRSRSLWYPAGAVLLVLTLSVLIWWQNQKYADYSVGASGIVVDSTGRPIGGATVRITFDEPVYRAIESLSTAVAQTDVTGEFSLVFIAHRPDQEYTLAVQSTSGSSTVSGAGTGRHHIVLNDH